LCCSCCLVLLSWVTLSTVLVDVPCFIIMLCRLSLRYVPYHDYICRLLPYLTLPYLTLPYLTLPYFTLPYPALPYPTLPHQISIQIR
jgi:hypothetical protein